MSSVTIFSKSVPFMR